MLKFRKLDAEDLKVKEEETKVSNEIKLDDIAKTNINKDGLSIQDCKVTE